MIETNVTENDVFWNFFHIMGKVFNVTNKNLNDISNCKDSFIVLFQLLGYEEMYPNKEYANILKSFMQQYNIKDYVKNNSTTFQYTYLLHSYVNIIKKKRKQIYNNITLDSANKLYDHITIDKWGPVYWKAIHRVCNALPKGELNEKQKKNILTFFSAIRFLIPCPECKAHLTTYLKDEPLYNHFSTGKEVFDWCYNLHNATNKRLNKPLISYSEALSMYN